MYKIMKGQIKAVYVKVLWQFLRDMEIEVTIFMSFMK